MWGLNGLMLFIGLKPLALILDVLNVNGIGNI